MKEIEREIEEIIMEKPKIMLQILDENWVKAKELGKWLGWVMEPIKEAHKTYSTYEPWNIPAFNVYKAIQETLKRYGGEK